MNKIIDGALKGWETVGKYCGALGVLVEISLDVWRSFFVHVPLASNLRLKAVKSFL